MAAGDGNLAVELAVAIIVTVALTNDVDANVVAIVTFTVSATVALNVAVAATGTGALNVAVAATVPVDVDVADAVTDTVSFIAPIPFAIFRAVTATFSVTASVDT